MSEQGREEEYTAMQRVVGLMGGYRGALQLTELISGLPEGS